MQIGTIQIIALLVTGVGVGFASGLLGVGGCFINGTCTIMGTHINGYRPHHCY